MPQSFPTKTSLKRQAAGFILLFAIWIGLAAWALLADNHKMGWPGIAITIGVPIGMCCLSVCLLLQSQTVLEVSDDGFRLNGPFGTQWTPWSVIRYADILGTDDSGLKLFDLSGKAVTVNFKQFDNQEQLPSLFLPHVRFDDGQEPLVAIPSGRTQILLVTVCTLGFFIPATLSLGPRGNDMWPIVMLLAVIFAPLNAFVWTFKVSLTGNVLKRGSCFGTQTMTIDSQTAVDQKLATSKNGTYERLKLTNPDRKSITLYGQLSRYPAFRSRILSLTNPAYSAVD